MRRVCGSVTALALGLISLAFAPRLARADSKAIAYTYEVENLDAYPEKVFVAWPRTCGSTGDPLGAVSLQLNPDWVSRLHEVDYEVLGPGRHQVSPYCARTTRVFALPSASFPRSSRTATADDTALGARAGETYSVLAALDEIELPKRIPFFAGDPRRVPSPFRFDVIASAPAGSPLEAVHDVIAIDGAFGGAAASFAIVNKRVIYTYDDGATDVVPYRAGGERPPPARGPALATDAGADAGARAAAAVDAGAAVSAAPGPTSPDRGTRWVYAAAIGGLLAGGVIAHYRKKRASAAPR